jgi:hypothetical protein
MQQAYNLHLIHVPSFTIFQANLNARFEDSESVQTYMKKFCKETCKHMNVVNKFQVLCNGEQYIKSMTASQISL